MTPVTTPRLAAALAGVTCGIQTHGAWAGRRQLLVRFAGEGETATLFTADALAREMNRILGRTTVHSVGIMGADTMGSASFLVAALVQIPQLPPVMVDTDGQRPEAVPVMRDHLRLVQVTVAGTEPQAAVDRAMQTLAAAAAAGVEHALVVAAAPDASDAQLVRVVEQGHAASAGTMLVVHPSPADRGMLDRRWSALMERAAAVHGDVRLAMPLPMR